SGPSSMTCQTREALLIVTLPSLSFSVARKLLTCDLSIVKVSAPFHFTYGLPFFNRVNGCAYDVTNNDLCNLSFVVVFSYNGLKGYSPRPLEVILRETLQTIFFFRKKELFYLLSITSYYSNRCIHIFFVLFRLNYTLGFHGPKNAR
ncbi:hypothetical protein L9F63_018222, partial [Diploptera punctata]